MEDFLFSIEDSTLGLAISSSMWGYPIALSLHALGMGVLVGISVMLALRVLGFANAIPTSAILPYWRLAIAGFIVNLLSGTALFAGSASDLASNWAFLAKLFCLLISLVLTFRMVKVAYKSDGAAVGGHRLLAYGTLAFWVATIVLGRLIGYIF